MGIYVYRARSPKKGLQEVVVGNETVKVAVAEYAYKVSYDKYGQEVYGDRYINPTERAWENWLDEGNERPQFIVCNEKLYRWTGLIGFYDHAVDSWTEVRP